jgi:trimeric autotransporter adhesin
LLLRRNCCGNVTGTAPLENHGSGIELCCGSRSNALGGTVSGAGNVISGNANDGIFLGGVGTDGTFIEGNFIGVDVTGAVPLPNAFDGVHIYGGAQHTQIGGTAPGARNIISGNINSGVLVENTTANFVRGNTIGLDATSTQPIPNQNASVSIDDAAQFCHPKVRF